MPNTPKKTDSELTKEWKENPSERLEKGFEKIKNTRMANIPVCHPKVGIKAVGFKPWNGYWLGCMVTPWALNLIIAEGDRESWKHMPDGKKIRYRFPAGNFDFICVNDRILGEYQMCSLMSPLTEITDHQLALDVAEAALIEIMKPEQPEEQGTPLTPSLHVPDPEATAKAVSDALNKPVKRRTFIKPDLSEEKPKT